MSEDIQVKLNSFYNSVRRYEKLLASRLLFVYMIYFRLKWQHRYDTFYRTLESMKRAATPREQRMEYMCAYITV